MATSLTDLHPHIIQTHILPRLDAPSLSATVAASPYLQSLCSDDYLWSNISKSTWPSITHPRVDDVISTFPNGYRSFFHDSFPSLTTDVNPRRSQSDCSSSHPWPSELISAVDIRYLNDIIYSKVEFTDTTTDFLSSASRIELKDSKSNQSGSIDLIIDELPGVDEATLAYLKDSVTLNWILIDPTLKRAGNLSSIKAVSARQDWAINQTILRYVTVLPGCDPNQMVQCKIDVALGLGKRGVGLYVNEVTLKLKEMDNTYLTGREFLVITQGAILEQNNVTRKVVVVVDEEQIVKSCKEFEDMKKQQTKSVRVNNEEEEKTQLALTLNCVGFVVSLFFSVFCYYNIS